MRTNSFIALAGLSLLLAGCGKKETVAKPDSKSGSNPVMAPVNYLDAAAKAKIKADKDMDVVAINKAIELFGTQEGRYPTDLNELVTKGFMRSIPKPPYGMKIVYDATKGEVKVVKQ
jgi:hypothetical protein